MNEEGVGDAQEYVDDPVVIEVDGGKAHRREEGGHTGPPEDTEARPAVDEHEERVGYVERRDGTEDAARSAVEGGEVAHAEPPIDARQARSFVRANGEIGDAAVSVEVPGGAAG